MGKICVAAATALLWSMVPEAVAAQAAGTAREATPEDAAAVEDVDRVDEEDVSGEPLAAPKGKVRTEPVEPAPEWTEDGRGIAEHRLYVVPRGTATTESFDAPAPRRAADEWGGKEFDELSRHSDAWTFPEVAPGVSGALLTVGGGTEDRTAFAERLQLDLWLLRASFDLATSLEGDTEGGTSMDLDLRIPISFSARSRLAIVPGVTFPIDGGGADASARTRAIYGASIGDVSVQLLGGAAVGPRQGGVLSVERDLDRPGLLAGGLVGVGLARVAELRGEVLSDIGAGGFGDAVLSLVPGVAFFPWKDRRLELGLAAVIEGAGAKEKVLNDPSFGGLLNLQLNFR